MTQITVPDVATTVTYNVASASTGPFVVPFAFFAQGDVFAYTEDLAGTITALVVTTDFTFTTLDTPVGQEGNGYEGGEITLNVAIGADGDTDITIYRDTAVDRTANYPTTGPFSMPILNDEQNRQTMMMQELELGIINGDAAVTVVAIAADTVVDDANIGIDGNDTMTGNLKMGNKKIKDLDTGVDPTDAVNLTQVEALLSALEGEDLRSTGAADDFILTSDGLGGVAWEANAAGGAPEGTSIVATGVTDGYVLTATGSNTSAWEAIPGVSAPEGITVLSGGPVTDGYVLTANGAGGAAWEVTASATPEGTAVLSTGPVTDGYVLTADGAGGAAWEAGGGGGGSQTPWSSDIDGAGFGLDNIDRLEIQDFTSGDDTITITHDGTDGYFSGTNVLGVPDMIFTGFGGSYIFRGDDIYSGHIKQEALGNPAKYISMGHSGTSYSRITCSDAIYLHSTGGGEVRIDRVPLILSGGIGSNTMTMESDGDDVNIFFDNIDFVNWGNGSSPALPPLRMFDTVVSGAAFENYGVVSNVTTSTSGTLVLTYEDGQVYEHTLTENVTTVSIALPPASGTLGEILIKFKQNGTGSWTVAWPASVKWPGGVAPVITTTATTGTDLISLKTWDAGTTWYGNFSQDYS